MVSRKVQAFTAIVFGSLLAIAVLTESSAGHGALGELQNAMRNLKRVDSLQMTYTFTNTQKGVVVGEQVDVWSNMLDGNWTSEHYTTDEDGTRIYLRQFCDGRNVYHYIDWNGEWEQAKEVSSTAVPNLEMITALSYEWTDIAKEEVGEENGMQKITYTFTSDYLAKRAQAQLQEIEASYMKYEKSGATKEQLASVERSVEQYRQTTYDRMTVTYLIDNNKVLRDVRCEVTLTMPEIVHDISGDLVLGSSQQVEMTIQVNVERYNQDGTLNKIEQCKNEMLY